MKKQGKEKSGTNKKEKLTNNTIKIWFLTYSLQTK